MNLIELVKERKYPLGVANKIRMKLGIEEWTDEKSEAAINVELKREAGRVPILIADDSRFSGDIKKEVIDRFNPQPKKG